MKKRQRGLTLLSMIMVGTLVGFFAYIGIRVTPAVIEYFTVLKNVKAIVASGETKGATVADIRRSYDRRATIDDTPSVTAADLDISKDGGEVVIGFSYSRKVPLFANVSLLLDFSGSTKPVKAGD